MFDYRKNVPGGKINKARESIIIQDSLESMALL